jgi:uncharacterized membrane protein YagU involved in acid resistance
MEWKKGVASGIVAGIVLLIVDFILAMVPGSSEWYSATFPSMVSQSGMLIWMASVFVVGFFMGLIYSVLNSAISGESIKKGAKYGVMVWLVAGLMWPIMMVSMTPAYLVVVELVSGLIGYVITGAVIGAVYAWMSKAKQPLA